MAVQWVLVCHGLITLLVLVSFLCGQWPIFQGTFIERIHVFLTFGAYDCFLYSLSLSQSILFPLLFLLNSFVWSLFVLALIGGLLGLCLGPKGPMRFYPLSISAVTDPILFYRFETRNLCYFLYPIGLFWNGYFFFFFFKPRNEKELGLHWIELWFWEMGLFSIISKQVKLLKKVIFNRRIANSR